MTYVLIYFAIGLICSFFLIKLCIKHRFFGINDSEVSFFIYCVENYPAAHALAVITVSPIAPLLVGYLLINLKFSIDVSVGDDSEEEKK